MPPCWHNKALPTPTLTLPDTLFSTFFIISFIFIENDCLSNVTRLFKMEGKKLGIKRVRTQVDNVKKTVAHTSPSTQVELMFESHILLTSQITRWWAGLV